MMIVEKEERDIESVTQHTYPNWADNIDRSIMDIIKGSPKSMSHNTLHNKYLRSINFFERLDRICKEVPGIKSWEQKKPTRQIGNLKAYEEFKKEEKASEQTN